MAYRFKNDNSIKMIYSIARFPFLFLLIFFFINAGAQNFDVDFLRSINKNGSSFKTSFSKADVQSVIIFGAAAPAGVFAEGLIKHDKKLQEDGLYMAGSYVASILVTEAAKRIINEERPFQKYGFIIQRTDETNGMSFPSAHASAAFCTATSLSLYFPKWYVIAPSYLWAASVGWARIYQGVHYPSDVLAGAIIGAGSAWLGYKIQGWMDKKKRKIRN